MNFAKSPTRPATYPRWAQLGSRWAESVLRYFISDSPHEAEAPSKILIIEPFRLGDAALLTGMLEPLRERFSGAEIHLLLSPIAAPLYERDPRVRHVHRFAFPWTDLPCPKAGWGATFRFLRHLRAQRFSLGIDPRGDLRSQFALVLAGCSERVGLGRYLSANIELRGRLLTRTVMCDRLAHRVEMHNEILRALGVRVPAGPLIRGHKPAHAQRRVLLCVGAGWVFRRWPEDRWCELAKRLSRLSKLDVKLIGAVEDTTILQRIAARVGTGVAVQSTGLSEFLDELSGADVVVSADSAAVHLASEWWGVPVVALFGPGVVSLYQPRSRGSVVLHHQDRFPCAPCLQKRCVRPMSSCMPTISVDEVAQAVLYVLSQLSRV